MSPAKLRARFGVEFHLGYPGEGSFNTHCSTDPCFPYSCSSPITSQGYVKYLNDPTASYGGWWSQGIGCYMTGGSSGGGMFQQVANQWYVVGVNSEVDSTNFYTANCFRPTGTCFTYSDNMWAPYFKIAIINAWFSLRIA